MIALSAKMSDGTALDKLADALVTEGGDSGAILMTSRVGRSLWRDGYRRTRIEMAECSNFSLVATRQAASVGFDLHHLGLPPVIATVVCRTCSSMMGRPTSRRPLPVRPADLHAAIRHLFAKILDRILGHR